MATQVMKINIVRKRRLKRCCWGAIDILLSGIDCVVNEVVREGLFRVSLIGGTSGRIADFGHYLIASRRHKLVRLDVEFDQPIVMEIV